MQSTDTKHLFNLYSEWSEARRCGRGRQVHLDLSRWYAREHVVICQLLYYSSPVHGIYKRGAGLGPASIQAQPSVSCQPY